MLISASPPSPAFLDTELALSQIGDAEAMTGLLIMLQEFLARDLPVITALLDAGDVPAANRVLHSLKGFLPIFCQEPLCAQLVYVEALSKDSHNAGIGPAYQALRPHLEILLSEVNDYLKLHAS